jgi:exonuclease III
LVRAAQKYGKTLIASDAPFIMVGDYNVMPTDLDVYAPERWRDERAVPAGSAQSVCGRLGLEDETCSSKASQRSR